MAPPEDINAKVEACKKDAVKLCQLSKSGDNNINDPAVVAKADALVTNIYQYIDLFANVPDPSAFDLKRLTSLVQFLQHFYLLKDTKLQRFVPDELKHRAQDLIQGWQAESLVPAVVRNSANVRHAQPVPTDNGNIRRNRRRGGAAVATGRPSSSSGSDRGSSALTVLAPPPNHPYFGRGRALDGIAKKSKSAVLNPERRGAKKSPRQFGHNGLEPGQWFAVRMLALWHGGHGVSQGGIHGESNGSAYSIVLSSMYKDLDSDQGEEIWYSASGAKDNTDPRGIGEGRMTEHLRQSWRTGCPVRVFRSSKCDSIWAPAEGYRYDGLYNVRETEKQFNDHGGQYVRFHLVRRTDQRSLRQCRDLVPVRKQEEIMAAYRRGY